MTNALTALKAALEALERVEPQVRGAIPLGMVEDALPLVRKAIASLIDARVLEGTVEAHMEDGGRALIAEVVEDDHSESGMFVRLQSWNNDARRCEDHTEIERFLDGRVRVTVEKLP